MGKHHGPAYLFDVTTGQQLAKLTNDDMSASDGFGISVTIDGHATLAGAYEDDVLGLNAGAAYLFDATILEPASLSALAVLFPVLVSRRRRGLGIS